MEGENFRVCVLKLFSLPIARIAINKSLSAARGSPNLSEPVTIHSRFMGLPPSLMIVSLICKDITINLVLFNAYVFDIEKDLSRFFRKFFIGFLQ